MSEACFRTGAGRLCLDLVRTLRYRGQPDVVEELPDDDAVLAWITQVGPPVDGPVVEHPALAQRTRTLREAIHQLVVMATTAKPISDQVRCAVNDAAGGPVPVPQLQPDGNVAWTATNTAAAVLALVARDALDLVTSPGVARVRRCASAHCGALFFDSSRSASRRWCSMGVCGNQAKRAAMRARR